MAYSFKMTKNLQHLIDLAPEEIKTKIHINQSMPDNKLVITHVNDISNNFEILNFLKNFCNIAFDYCVNCLGNLHEGVKYLTFYGEHYEDFSTLPSTLIALYVYGLYKHNIDNLPQNTLKILSVNGNISLNNLPSSIEILKICYFMNLIIHDEIDNIPDSVKYLFLENINNITFYINKLPKSIKKIYLINDKFIREDEDINFFKSKLRGIDLNDFPNLAIIETDAELYDDYKYHFMETLVYYNQFN